MLHPHTEQLIFLQTSTYLLRTYNLLKILIIQNTAYKFTDSALVQILQVSRIKMLPKKKSQETTKPFLIKLWKTFLNRLFLW